MRDIESLIVLKILSRQNDFSWIIFIFSLAVYLTLNNNSTCIKWSFSIGFFEWYVNSKRYFLEFLLSVVNMLKHNYETSNNIFLRKSVAIIVLEKERKEKRYFH